MARNKDTDIIVEDEDAGAETRVYELGFHLDPELPIEGVKKAYQAIHDSIAKKGTIIAEVEPEKIQLAYTISRQDVAGRRDFDSAYFAWIAYEMPVGDHTEVIAAANANPSCIRFIDLITTKDAARHALEAHELSKNEAPIEQVGESEGDSINAELDAALETATA